MIERLLVKNHLSFESCEMTFKEGLVVFTGPSGAGKSVLMRGLLSLFGYGEASADGLVASIVQHLGLEASGFEEDEPNVFKIL